MDQEMQSRCFSFVGFHRKTTQQCITHQAQLCPVELLQIIPCYNKRKCLLFLPDRMRKIEEVYKDCPCFFSLNSGAGFAVKKILFIFGNCIMRTEENEKLLIGTSINEKHNV